MRISRPFLFIAATLAVIVAVGVGLGMGYGASFLRVSRPQHADVILVLGEGPTTRDTGAGSS